MSICYNLLGANLTYDRALSILIDVSDALHLMHTHFDSERLVHCDLKPDNIVMDEVSSIVNDLNKKISSPYVKT